MRHTEWKMASDRDSQLGNGLRQTEETWSLCERVQHPGLDQGTHSKYCQAYRVPLYYLLLLLHSMIGCGEIILWL